MRYTKQVMTLTQQIQTLQSRGLIIADTVKAEQALDAISYFRLAERKEVGRSKERYIREHFRKYTDPDLPPVWKTLEVISMGELSKLFNNFSKSQLKHLVAHDFGLNHHKFLSSWMESLTSLRNHCAHHARVWNRAYPIKPATPHVMPNKWLTDFTFREESLYAQLCCIAYWLNAIDAENTFVGDMKLLLLRYPIVDPALMGFPANWRQEPIWQL